MLAEAGRDLTSVPPYSEGNPAALRPEAPMISAPAVKVTYCQQYFAKD